MGIFFDGDEVDLSGTKEPSKKLPKGFYGGDGHRENCEDKGPIQKKPRSKGFFQSPEIYDQCEKCGEEITGVITFKGSA